MSIDAVQYVVRGYNLDCAKCEDLWNIETTEDITSNESGKISFIYDGMSGEYIIAGEVLAKSDEYGDFGGVIALSKESKLTDDEIYSRVMDITKGMYPLPPIETLVFTHYS